MGVVQLPDELQRLIEQQVVKGRAASTTAFLAEAVMRLVDEVGAEEDAIWQAVEAGSADVAAGRTTTVATPEDGQVLQERLMARVQARLAADGWLAYRLTRAAEDQIDAVEDQIDAVLLDSAHNYGLEAAGRYGQLILVVMAALGGEPDMPGSVEVPRVAGVRAYPTRLGRQQVEPVRRVAAPRHLVIYRLAADGIVEILGLVHDRMVLSRAARKAVRSAEEG